MADRAGGIARPTPHAVSIERGAVDNTDLLLAGGGGCEATVVTPTDTLS
jgi:hypothetical protein